MQHDHVLKIFNFDILILPPKSIQGVGHRSLIQNYVWYVSYILYLCLQLLPCCCIRDSFDVQHDHALIKLNFDLLRGEWRAAGKKFATILLHSRFPLIWYVTWSCSKIVEFQPLDPQGQGEGRGCGQNVCYHIAAFPIPFNLIWNMTMFCKSYIWPFDPRVGGRGRGQNICYHFTALAITFNLICNMTMFWQSWIFIFWPPGSGGGGGLQHNICYHVAARVIPFNLICNMTMFWKSFILTFDPTPLVHPGVEHKHSIKSQDWYVSYLLYLCLYLLPCCCIRDSLWYATWQCSEKIQI